MLEQNYLDKFKPFQCPNIINNEESNVSSVESHTDYCVELEVIWSIKNNSQVTSEQMLYYDERELSNRLPNNNIQVPSYEEEHCLNTAPVLSVSKSIDSTQSDNNGVSPSDINYQTLSINPIANKQDSTSLMLHKKDSILSTTVDTKIPIDVLLVSSTDEKTSSEQSSDAAYISPESKIPVTSTIGKAYPLSTILEFNNITGYDTNIQINSPLSPSNVYPTTNSKSNACQLLSITTNENLGCNAKDSTGNDDDFNMKPCFGDTDCDEIYRTAHKGPEIGRGSYGIVSLYVTRTKRMIAVKEIKLDEDDSERLCGDFKWVQEVYILRALDHPYVVKFYGISIENSRLVKIFTEYVPNGTVDNMLKLFGPFPNNVLQKYTRQIVEGVAYLHDEGVIHRDIKGKNVMLDKYGNIKLIDFGCAIRLMENPNTNSVEQIFGSLEGTLYWMAPEIITKTGHGEKADIWSIGCTLYEMATGKPPWLSEDNFYAVLIIIAQGTKPSGDLPERCSPEAQNFFRLCLTRDPTLRPSASDLLSHTFLNS
ncbi:unnamed protein product [Rotaria sordida]|uniref:Protein kinase domain-containing protein n=1 Tax=Rotaria sordida TaxID=392033 RepID=A0A814PZX2_9BILA|nr:unnamed protein product [Rotaria sordida]CAF1326739.1 unnamed protein product [Rotaria sordida]